MLSHKEANNHDEVTCDKRQPCQEGQKQPYAQTSPHAAPSRLPLRAAAVPEHRTRGASGAELAPRYRA